MNDIRTDRLLLRSWKDSDLDYFIQMNKDSEVMKYFPNKLSAAKSREFIKKIKNHFSDHNFGLWAVELLKTGEFIGFIGFKKANFRAEFTPCIEIGWRLGSKYWKKGYATEGAAKCLEYGFESLNFKEVYSFTAKINKASIRVMQKIAMQKEKEFDHPALDNSSPLRRHVLYKITKGDWKTKKHFDNNHRIK